VWAVKAAYWLADRFVLDPIFAGPVNRLRAEHSLPPVKRLLNEWWLSPDRIIAMYPRWFAPATEMFFPRLVHAGFPLEDLDERTEIEPTDRRPIVFTAGTANHHGKRFFERAADACSQLNHPGILLSTHNENFPESLPKLVSTHNYVSLRSLLPACGAIVHHGGIGTTSQALAAATPQIIRPMAFDQFDNATRVAALGCGIWLRHDRNLIAALSACLAGKHDEGCRQAAARIEVTPAAKIAADEIRKLVGTGG
jgi:UDP:flavonoid glycosyltransferase YjiC (YdhE family)